MKHFISFAWVLVAPASSVSCPHETSERDVEIPASIVEERRLAAGFRQVLSDFLDESLGRNLERCRKPENHVQRWRAEALFEPGNVAPLQPGVTGKIRLTPSFAKTPSGDDLSEAGTDLVDFVQTTSVREVGALVAVTIGPEIHFFSLTSDLLSMPTATSFWRNH